MTVSDIVVKGAREHNLRGVDLVLPRNRLICFTGVSGSGKSSLAFDTLYAEGQRRYIESLSTYARQFLGQLPKPDVDLIRGLSPSISISQKSAGSNPRSTVGTMTEIYDFLRVLYARVGTAFCPECQRPITAQTREQILGHLCMLPQGTRFMILAPIIRGQKGEHRDLLADLRKQGYARARIDGQVFSLQDDPKLDRRLRHDIEIVVDRLTMQGNIRSRLAEALELGIRLGKGTIISAVEDSSTVAATSDSDSRGPTSVANDRIFSVDYACTHCGIGFTPPSPQLFSFNSPQGMCTSCMGLGTTYSFDLDLLIPNPGRSLREGCIDLMEPWKTLSRWQRHVFGGVADTMERVLELPGGTLLDTPWRDLDERLRRIWLHGAGDQHITFTWRGGASPIMYGGKFKGILTDLMDRYRTAKSKPLIARLERYMRMLTCHECQGARINPLARHVRLETLAAPFSDQPARSLPQLCQLSILDAHLFLSRLSLNETQSLIAEGILNEILGRLQFLLNVGLDYLSLERTAPTLSGGESQRIRLASQVGCGLVGVLYILDEPSIGLHPRDNERLLATLEQLRDIGNTVIVVEHDEETIRRSDHVVDFGPGAGIRGGDVTCAGSVADVAACRGSITGEFLSGKREIAVPTNRRAPSAARLQILGANHNNLKEIDVHIPLGLFVCVTGVSGSGKSSLVNDILIEALQRDLNHGQGQPGQYRELLGLEHLDKMIAIDQSPIGRTPRSNPATYIKVFDEIRKLYTRLPESKKRGYQAGRFSFNVEGGRCSACGGNGSNRLEMDFLADIWVTCPVCEGHRFNRETLAIQFKGHSIADVLEMDVQQALELFQNISVVETKLRTLHDVGLDYLKLGQPSPTLSGGEAQRIKLARELVKRSTGKTIYLLDEPTTGLHFADVQLLLQVLHNFVSAGNTVIVVEHNLDVVKTADWVIDLGPEGGAQGGTIVAEGTPEQIARQASSHTGQALRKILAKRSRTSMIKKKTSAKRNGRIREIQSIQVEHAGQHNLKDVSLKIPRDQMTVFCGPSGSGKSSLAIDTIYAEGQRRYVESLSAYARQFVGQMQKPRVEHIEGLSPAIALEQKNVGHTPRSTVGTTTEIYDYLRVLYARLGTPYCPHCDLAVGTQTVDEIIEKVLQIPNGTRAYLMAPLVTDVDVDYDELWESLRGSGYLRVRVDGTTHTLDQPPDLDRKRRHQLEIVMDRVTIRSSARHRLAESIEATLAIGRGVLHVAHVADTRPEPEWPVDIHSQHLACTRCGTSFERLNPHHFSFNSQIGWCPDCMGLGVRMGTDSSVLLAGPETTLEQGAVLLWPNLTRPVAQVMLTAWAERTGVPLDVPLSELTARHRRLLLHGTGERWFDVLAPATRDQQKHSHHGQRLFRFQYKGIYPALEEAARLSPMLRLRLQHLTGEVECLSCAGSRLRSDAAAARFRDRTIDDLCRLPLSRLADEIARWKLDHRERQIAGELIREIKSRVTFLIDVGLGYLTLHRPAATLSGGESQRIRLASQLGSGLCGVLYVLDEPTIGLHPRDNQRLLSALRRLRDLGNTLILVEHDREIIGGSDYLVDFGPAAGRYGGEILAAGKPDAVQRRRSSVTGPFLSRRAAIPIPAKRREVTPPAAVAMDRKVRVRIGQSQEQRAAATDWLEIHGARQHNLKDIDVRIPLGKLVAVTGPSGSGKSSLIDDILYASLAARLHNAATAPGAHREIRGIEYINKVIRVDQHALGNSPASNPATYTGVFDLIRELYAYLPEAKIRGYSPRRFSFNVPGGRCETCEGNGQKCIQMHFLPDVWITCSECNGTRFNAETLLVRYHGHSIADVLQLSCREALSLFEPVAKIRRILQTLVDVGLDYVSLGQPAPTLSGGEAQRVKLAAELARPDTGSTLYLLDEPTTGLHFQDLIKLLSVLQRLVDLGNSVVVIEHNLDVIKAADWVIDMGPEAGAGGGYVVAEGTPESITQHLNGNGARRRGKMARQAGASKFRSYTAEALAPVLKADPIQLSEDPPVPVHEQRAGDLEIRQVGEGQKMPWEIDGQQWHTVDRVDRKGDPCRWEGRILREIVDRVQSLGTFAPTDWNNRSVVEITASHRPVCWFLHAITAETWLLKIKIRVARNTFRREELLEQLPLKTLSQMDQLPIYGNEPRVRMKIIRGRWQEIEMRLHSWEETDSPAFWQFLEDAVRGYQRIYQRVQEDPANYTPWKKLGKIWHLSRKGFPPGKKIDWEAEVLESLVDTLQEKFPDGEYVWTNQQIVHLYSPGTTEPCASIMTKRLTDVELVLNAPKGRFPLGRVTSLGYQREVDTGEDRRDWIKLRFRRRDEVGSELSSFLDEYAQAMTSVRSSRPMPAAVT